MGRARPFADEMPMTADPGAPIDLAQEPDFPLGTALVRPSKREIAAHGRAVTLEPRVMQVLVALAQEQGQTVSRDVLIARGWGGVVVGEDAIQRCIGRLRKISHELGCFEIATLPKIGYRLTPLPHDSSVDPGRLTAITVMPGIWVAPLKLLTHSDADEQFCRVLTSELTIAFGLHRDVRVLAPGSVDPDASYVRLREAAAIHFVLEGQVRRIGAQRRVTISLVETAAGEIVWTERIDDVPDETAENFDDVIIAISSRALVEIMRYESARVLKRDADLTAFEAVVRSNWTYQRISVSALPHAITYARRAVEIDPHYGHAHAALANALAAMFEVSGGREASLAAEAKACAERALELDPDNPSVLASCANALCMTTRPPEGSELALRAVALGPTNAIARLYLGRRYLLMQEPDNALAAFAEYERLAPHSPWHYFTAFNRSLAHFMAGRLDLAERELDRAFIMNPGYPYTSLAKAILLALTGRTEEAAASIGKLKAIDGDASLDLQLARVSHSFPEGELRDAVTAALVAAWNCAP